MWRVRTLCNIQGDSGRKVNIFGGDIIGHCEKKAYAKAADIVQYTEWFRTKSKHFCRWYYWLLWEKKAYVKGAGIVQYTRWFRTKGKYFGGDIIGHCEKKAYVKGASIVQYTGWFRKKSKHFSRWYYWSLWEKSLCEGCEHCAIYRVIQEEK